MSLKYEPCIDRCDQLERSLQRIAPCAAIHGDKDQHQRTKTLNDFKAGHCCVMVATDVVLPHHHHHHQCLLRYTHM
jgi:superfamily II DNA/RNA helicase